MENNPSEERWTEAYRAAHAECEVCGARVCKEPTCTMTDECRRFGVLVQSNPFKAYTCQGRACRLVWLEGEAELAHAAMNFAALDLRFAGIDEAGRLSQKHPTDWGADCFNGHVEARTSELAFKLRTKSIGTQPDGLGGAFPLGVCHCCKTSIGYPTDEQRAALGLEEA